MFLPLAISATPGASNNRAYTAEVSSNTVRVYLGKAFVRAYSIPKGHTAEVLLTSDKLILFEDERPRWGDYWLRIYNLNTGRLLIQRTGYGNISKVYVKSSSVFLQYSSVGGQISTSTLVQDHRESQKTFVISGWKIAENERSILFNGPNGNYNPYEPVKLNYYRYDISTKSISNMSFRIAERNQCGSVEKDGTQNEGETFNASEVIAARHDKCGAFTVKFTWK